MALSAELKRRIALAIPDQTQADELIAAIDAASARSAEAELLAALTGTLTGTANGSLADVAAAAGACAGGATPSATNVDAAIATAVAPIVSGVNEQLKELQAAVNGIIAALKA